MVNRKANPSPSAPIPVGEGGGSAVTVVAVETIRHDGDNFAPGAHFTVSPEQAAALIAAGAAQAAG